MSRLYERYKKDIVPSLQAEYQYRNPMQIPKLKKIVLNVGAGETLENPKSMEFIEYALTQISGQKPSVRRAKKAIATYKLRKGLPIGCMVTLRNRRMYEFLDRLISIALPRVKDFKGVPNNGFDGSGNYTLGIKEQIVFPELNIEKLDKIRGMNITFVTSAPTDKESRSLLKQLGMPFREQRDKEK